MNENENENENEISNVFIRLIEVSDVLTFLESEGVYKGETYNKYAEEFCKLNEIVNPS